MIKGILDRIAKKDITVGIVGLGYVGLPLAKEFVRVGFKTIGFDVDPEKIKLLRKSQTYIKHIPSEALKKMNETRLFSCTDDFAQSKKCDALIICVPTPLTHHREPDMSYIVSTAESLAPYVRKGNCFHLSPQHTPEPRLRS